MHLPIPEQGRWLASVLRGHYRYYAVPDNIEALRAFREGLIRHWLRSLRRRSQKQPAVLGADGSSSLTDGYLYRGSCIPGPSSDSPSAPKAGAQCGSPARWDLRGGQPEAVWTHVPTRPKGCPYRNRPAGLEGVIAAARGRRS